MKKFLLVFATALLIFAGCNKKVDNDRDDFVINENIDNLIGADSLNVLWKIEDHLLNKEELNEDTLFDFTDMYLVDESKFESLNQEEKNIVMATSGIISKVLRSEYDDQEGKKKFEEDKNKFHQTLESGE